MAVVNLANAFYLTSDDIVRNSIGQNFSSCVEKVGLAGLHVQALK